MRDLGMPLLNLARDEVQHAVQALHPLEVGTEIVEKDGRQRMASHLRERGIGRRRALACGRCLASELSDGDDEDASRPEVQCGRQWRDLTHRAVCEIIVADAPGGKDERYRRRSEQMFDADHCRLAAPARAL